MKSILFFMTAAISLSACAQQNVPEAAKKALAVKFPEAKSVKWSEEKEKGQKPAFEAEFTLNGTECSANFNDQGTWMETELSVGKNQLPAVVLQTLEKEFAGWKTGEIASLETPDMKGFEIGLKKAGEKIEVVIDPSGKVLKKEELNEKKQAKDEDEEDEKD